MTSSARPVALQGPQALQGPGSGLLPIVLIQNHNQTRQHPEGDTLQGVGLRNGGTEPGIERSDRAELPRLVPKEARAGGQGWAPRGRSVADAGEGLTEGRARPQGLGWQPEGPAWEAEARLPARATLEVATLLPSAAWWELQPPCAALEPSLPDTSGSPTCLPDSGMSEPQPEDMGKEKIAEGGREDSQVRLKIKEGHCRTIDICCQAPRGRKAASGDIDGPRLCVQQHKVSAGTPSVPGVPPSRAEPGRVSVGTQQAAVTATPDVCLAWCVCCRHARGPR